MYTKKYYNDCFYIISNRKANIIILSHLPSAFSKYTLKNKGASRYHRRTFLSKWFHKEPLTSEEPFCFTKASLW